MKRFTLAGLALALPSIAGAQPFQPLLANVGPIDIDFGAIKVGTQVSVPVTIRNLSSTTLSLSGGGFNTSNGFSGNAGTCGGSVAAGVTCNWNYSFRPTSSNGNVVANQTAIGFTNASGTQLVPITVTGSGTGTLVHLGPTTIDFGSVFVGETVVVPVVVENNSGSAVTFAGGGFGTSNGFTGSGGTCGGGLAAGASCNFNYSFTPGQTGPLANSTSLSVITSAPAVSQSYLIQVSGTGVNSVGLVGFVPPAFGFGTVMVGDEFFVRPSYVNRTAGTLNFAGGGISLPSAFAGIGVTDDCGSSNLPAGATCYVDYRFRPLAPGADAATTSMSFSNASQSQQVNISMTASGSGVVGRVWPLSVNLGRVRQGTSISVPVTVTNTTWAPITGFVGGNVLSPFSSSNNCPASLPVGSSCQFTYGFSAGAGSIGPRSTITNLSFTNSSGVQPVYTIELYAEGYDTLFAHQFESN